MNEFKVTEILLFIQHHSPGFTRDSLYKDIDLGILKTIRNPRAVKGYYKVAKDVAFRYIEHVLEWKEGTIQKLYRGSIKV